MSSPIFDLGSVSREDVYLVGGKAAHIGEIMSLGLPVPNGFVLSTAATEELLRSANIREGLTAKSNDRELLARSVQGVITSSIFPPETENAILERCQEIGTAVAIRSSTTEEDQPSKSFAGQHQTFLGIVGAAMVLDCIKKCIGSLFSANALLYSVLNGIEHSQISIAVIVQRMVYAEKAGVMFTANPVNGNRSEVLIESCFGLGEGVVSGRISPDLLKLEKETGVLTSYSIGAKKWGLFLTQDPETSVSWLPLPPEKTREATLSEEEACTLVAYGRRIESYFGSPQDIEWAIDEHGIQIVQSRPITTL